jgi:hypothetical protein
MDVTYPPGKEVSATTIARVGAELDFAVQRFAYLRQHPDGQAGQPFPLDNAVAFSMVLMLVILLDVLLDVCDGCVPYGNDFEARPTAGGMDVIIRIRRVPDEARPGYRLIKNLASSVTVDHDKRLLMITMSAASINAGFPEQDPSVCPPSIAR